MLPQGTPPSTVGAGYIQAVLSDDTALMASYLYAFKPDELLTALEGPLKLLARYLGYHINATPTEVGDALMNSALHQAGPFGKES